MAATHSPADPTAKPRRRRRLWFFLTLPIATLGLALWWLTAPLDDQPTGPPPKPNDSDAPPPISQSRPERMPVWPVGALSGDEAKELLLNSALVSTARLSRVQTYTATLRKQERLGGRLGPENVLAMKVRNHPFAIYLKFLSPKAGKEVVYAEGYHENKVVAHNGDWTRKLVPRLAVSPDSAIAMADQRHPVTEAGLLHLANKLLTFRKMDIGDNDATTIIDRTTDDEGRSWLRSVHTHTVNDGSRPFARVEILYQPATQFPIRIFSYDWPDPSHSGELELAERYAYEDLDLEAALSATDFDITNPDYAFTRF